MPDSASLVVAAVISRGDKLLVCRRAHDKRYGGLWEFPGGKCEAGESLLATARRELHEELGVEVVAISDAEFSSVDSDAGHEIVFVPTWIHGNPVCLEHIELQWATPREIVQMQMAPSDKQFIDFRIGLHKSKIDARVSRLPWS